MSNKQQYDDNMMGQQTSNDGQSINSVNNLTTGQTIINNHNSDHPDERYYLKWNDFTKNVSVEFERLREDEDLVDITFACDGRKIGAHKLVLFASSQYFKNILKNNSCSHPIFYMNDVRFDVLEAILKYIYLGEVQIKNEDLKDFIKIAEALQVKGISKERYGATPTSNLEHHTINNSSNPQHQHQVGLHLNSNNNNAYHHGHQNHHIATTTTTATPTPSTAHHHNHNQPQQHQNQQQQLSIHIAPSHSSTSSINSISSSRGSNSTGGGIIEGNININIVSTTGTVAANDDNNGRHHLDNNSHQQQQQQHHHHQSTSSSNNGNGTAVGGNNNGTGKQHHHNQQQQPSKIDGSNHSTTASLPVLTNINLVAQAQQHQQQQQQQQQQHTNHHHAAHQPIESKIEIVEYKNESCSSPNYCHMETSLSHRLGASSSASTPNAMATGDEMWEDKASTLTAAAAAVSAVYSAGLHHSAAAAAAVAAVAAGHHVGGGGSSSGDETKCKPYHIKTKRPRSCPVCSRVYSNVSNLRQHMRLIHNPTAVICPVCQKRFNSDLYLKRHLSIHGFTFNQSDNTITDKKLQHTGGGSSTGNSSVVGNPGGGTTSNTWTGCNDANQIAVASSICR